MLAQPVGVHQHVAAGVAVVGVHPHHRQALLAAVGRQRQALAQPDPEAARQLLAEHGALTRGQLRPGVGALLQQRPVLAVDGVIDDALQLHRPALQAQVDAPARQHQLDARPACQPGIDRQPLRSVARHQVQVGGQALVEPADEGLAKALGHAADPDAGGQRQQQGHQRQRQSRQLLAAVGHEPLGQRSAAMSGQQGQRGVEQCR
ncbi:hypothetical protein D3C78_1101400 [compost metagenome]